MSADARLPRPRRAGPGHLGSHTSPVSLGFGVLIALLLLVVPGAIVARSGAADLAAAVAVGPALTYGVVALAIVPFGALGIPWNAWTALLALRRGRRARGFADGCSAGSATATPNRVAASRGPALLVAAGVVLGAVLIGLAAVRGMPHWQSIPSTWDAVWHANTIRFILDTGQASPTHMGELRNIETHEALYYPSTFHALAAVFSQLTGAAPTTAYTLQLAGRGDLAVPRQRRDADLAPAAQPRPTSGAPRARRPPRRRCPRRSPRSPTSSSTPRRCPTWPPTASRCRPWC